MTHDSTPALGASRADEGEVVTEHKTESRPPMAHVSAAAATGHEDYCPCAECEAHRHRYVTVDATGGRPMVLCADGSWTETCNDQGHADRQRLFWDREVSQCAPHRVSWEPTP